MSDHRKSLADVLKANRRLAQWETREAEIGTAAARGMRENASETLAAMMDEYTAALEQHIKAELIRAVASMPGHTTEQATAHEAV